MTSRLLLSPITEGNLSDLFGLYSERAVAEFVGGERLTAPAIAQQTEDFAAEWGHRGYGRSAVYRRDTGDFIGWIGWIGLHYMPHWDDIELGYVLNAAAQGVGFAREGCLAWLDWAKESSRIESVIASIHPDNASSIRLAMKLGFDLERRDCTPSGRPTLVYRRSWS